MKTAVECLVDQIFGENTNYYLQWKLEIDQALEMEKEQITDAYKEGYDQGYDHGLHEDEPEDSFDYYYTEIYKSDGETLYRDTTV